jgi:hypothetical protein
MGSGPAEGAAPYCCQPRKPATSHPAAVATGHQREREEAERVGNGITLPDSGGFEGAQIDGEGTKGLQLIGAGGAAEEVELEILGFFGPAFRGERTVQRRACALLDRGPLRSFSSVVTVFGVSFRIRPETRGR